MRLKLALASLVVVLGAMATMAAPPAPPAPTLTVTCESPDPQTGNCPLGVLLFAEGDGYPHKVWVEVTRPSGATHYQSGHFTTDGHLIVYISTGVETGTWNISVFKGKRNLLATADFEVD